MPDRDSFSHHILHNEGLTRNALNDTMDRIVSHMRNGQVLSPDFRWQQKKKNVIERALDTHRMNPNAEIRFHAMRPLIQEYNHLQQSSPSEDMVEGQNRIREGGALSSRLDLHTMPVVIPGNYSYITNR